MMQRLASIAVSLVGIFVFSAQSMMPGFPPGVFSSRNALDGVGYTGPGDVVSGATAAYALRAYNAAYIASGAAKAVNLRRASDNTTQDINVLTTGNFDTASANTFAGTDATCTATAATTTTINFSGCSSTPHANSTMTATGGSGSVTQPMYIVSCGSFSGGAGQCTSINTQTFTGVTATIQYGLFVVTAYDQSGANACSSAPCNITQGTQANQPMYLPNCGSVSKSPCLLFQNSSANLNLTTAPTHAIPVSISVVAQANPVGTQRSVGGTYNGASGFLTEFRHAADNTTGMFDGAYSADATAADGATHSIQYIDNGGSLASTINVDGTATAVSTGASPVGFNTWRTWGQSGNSFAVFIGGYSNEIIYYPLGLSSGQQTALCHNQYTYWSTSTSC